MKYLKRNFGNIGAVVALSLLAGCLLSGTFVLSVKFANIPVSGNNENYFVNVDITGEDLWEDHKDNIKDIDLVGFELWATNNTGVANTFSAYFADSLSSLDASSTHSEIVTQGILCLNNLPLSATGQTHITYGQSFKYIANLDQLKKLTEDGKFKLFLVAGESTIDFELDLIRVIVTFTAGV